MLTQAQIRNLTKSKLIGLLRHYDREELVECLEYLGESDDILKRIRLTNLKRHAFLEELKAEQFTTSATYIANKEDEKVFKKEIRALRMHRGII